MSHAKSYIESSTRFDQDGGQEIPDPNAYTSYCSDANYDVRQRFSFSGTYTLPGLNSGIGRVITSGWELTSIAVAQTGTPFWVICSGPLAAITTTMVFLTTFPIDPALTLQVHIAARPTGLVFSRLPTFLSRYLARKGTCRETFTAIQAWSR
jgi:hypothetical protein